MSSSQRDSGPTYSIYTEGDATPKSHIITLSKLDQYYLAVVNFFSLSNGKPGTFIAPFLLGRGYAEGEIGVVLFCNGMATLLSQTPSGEFVDYTSYKRTVVILSNLLNAFTILVVILTKNYVLVVLAMCIQGVTNAVIFPVVYSITLGMVGSSGIVDQVPINETAKFVGNLVYALAAGIAVYMTDKESFAFWICVGLGVLTAVSVLFISPDKIDYDRARGVTSIKGKESEHPQEVVSYSKLFSDKKLPLFMLCVLLFHLGNAAMLPLLSLFTTEFIYATLNVIVAQLVMIVTAASCASLIPQWGTKRVFLFCSGLLPVRAAVIVLLITYYDNELALVATQVFDGVIGGLFGVISVLIVENLTKGTPGRFSLCVGLVKTAEAIGGSFSNLGGGYIAQVFGYRAAFVCLGVIGLLPLIIYALWMPDSRVDEETLDTLQRTIRSSRPTVYSRESLVEGLRMSRSHHDRGSQLSHFSARGQTFGSTVAPSKHKEGLREDILSPFERDSAVRATEDI